jgi:Ca-activated chloride channel homolog
VKRGQLLIAILAAVAVAIVAVVSTGGGGDSSEDNGEPRGQQAPKGAVRIPFAYSPEKEKLLEPLIREFN